MPKRITIHDAVRCLVRGIDREAAFERLQTSGTPGINALLDALEGRFGEIPKGRHPIDFDDDMSGGLQAIAKFDPQSLIRMLKLRPRHSFILIWALGASSTPAATETLIEYTQHREPFTRGAALAGLARYPKKSLLPVLLNALRDRSPSNRFTALQGLVHIADHRAIDPLKKYLTDKRLRPGARRIASELLESLETEAAQNAASHG